MAAWYQLSDNLVSITLHIQPGAKRNQIVGLHGDALKIKLAAPPIDGRANEELLKFIADIFGVPQKNVALLRGPLSRHKVVTISDSLIAPDTLLKKE